MITCHSQDEMQSKIVSDCTHCSNHNATRAKPRLGVIKAHLALSDNMALHLYPSSYQYEDLLPFAKKRQDERARVSFIFLFLRHRNAVLLSAEITLL